MTKLIIHAAPDNWVLGVQSAKRLLNPAKAGA
jgi:hypothetical protein